MPSYINLENCDFMDKKCILNSPRSLKACQLKGVLPNELYYIDYKEYLDSPRRMMNGYRGFLYQVETAMRMTGYEKSQINSLFNKFKTLTPPQFLELYKTNNLINRLYEIVKSPVHGEAQLTLAEDDARELLDALIEEIDDDIANLTTK